MFGIFELKLMKKANLLSLFVLIEFLGVPLRSFEIIVPF